MSDTTDSTPMESSGDTAVESAPVETPAAEASVLDSELPEGMRSFDRSYVEKVRAEAAGNRTRARELEAQIAEREARLAKLAAFDGYSDEDLEVWSGMASDWKADPAVAAATFMDIAKRVLGDPTSTAAEVADAQAIIDNPAIAEAAQSLTPDQVREIAREETAAQTAAREQKEAVDGIFKQIESAGYKEGTPEAFSVLWYANNTTGGDIAKAIEAHKAYEQAIVDRYVEQMAKGGTPVRLASAGEAATPTGEPPKDINDARRQADAWLAEMREA